MKGFLLDSAALLAARLPEFAPGSSRLFLQQAQRERWTVCVSAMSLANVGRRLARLRHAQRRAAHDYLWRWFEQLTTQHPQAVLPFDGAMAVTAAHLQAIHRTTPLRSQIGACALAHDLAIVTATPGRYADMGVRVWSLRRPQRAELPQATATAATATATATPTATAGATTAASASAWALLTNRNLASARDVCRPLGPVPGLPTRPSRLRWGYARRARASPL